MDHAKVTRIGSQLRNAKGGHAFGGEKETHGASHYGLRGDSTVSANAPTWMQIKEVTEHCDRLAARGGEGPPTMKRLISGPQVRLWGTGRLE